MYFKYGPSFYHYDYCYDYHQNFYGSKSGNNGGEWLSVDTDTGDLMVFTDSDTRGGFGFLKLSPVQ